MLSIKLIQKYSVTTQGPAEAKHCQSSSLAHLLALQKKERTMKVLFVTPHFPPSLGGVENYVLSIALGLKQTYDYEVVVVTSAPNGKKHFIEDYCGLKVYRLPTMLRISNTPI